MSLLVDFVVHVLVDVVSVALLVGGSTNVLSDPDDWSGLCDGDDDLDIGVILGSTCAR